MSFLDKVKEMQQQAENGMEKNSNPLKNNPLKNNPLKNNPLKNNPLKSNPLVKKQDKVNPFANNKPKIEEKKDDKPIIKEEKEKNETVEKKDDKPKIEEKKDIKEEKKDIKEEKKDPKPKTEEKKDIKEKKKNDKSKKEEKKNKKENKSKQNNKKPVLNIQEKENMEKLNFHESMEMLKPDYVDLKWEEWKNEIENDLAEIQIEPDINTEQFKILIAKLDTLRNKVWKEYLHYKTEYELLTSDKPEGLMERVKRTAFSEKDRNAEDRKKAGIIACTYYEKDEKIINLYELYEELKRRFDFLNQIMRSIQFKADSFIKINGILKLEPKLDQ